MTEEQYQILVENCNNALSRTFNGNTIEEWNEALDKIVQAAVNQINNPKCHISYDGEENAFWKALRESTVGMSDVIAWLETHKRDEPVNAAAYSKSYAKEQTSKRVAREK